MRSKRRTSCSSTAQLLRLDGGEVLVDGTVDALTYEDSQPAGSFLARLFG